MSFCHECGAKSHPDDAFCAQCGASLYERPVESQEKAVRVEDLDREPSSERVVLDHGSVTQPTTRPVSSSADLKDALGARVIQSSGATFVLPRKSHHAPFLAAIVGLVLICVIFSSSFLLVSGTLAFGTTVVLGGSLAIGALFFSQQPLGTFTSEASLDASATTARLNICCPAGAINVQFSENLTSDVSVTSHAWGRPGSTFSAPDISSDLSGSVMIDTTDHGDVGWRLMIKIRKTLPIYIQIDSEAAAVKTQIPSGVNLTGLYIETSAGVMDIDVADGAAISGDMFLKGVAGAVNMQVSNCVLTRNIAVEIQNTVGAINIDWIQSDSTGGNVTMTAETTVGAVHFDLNASDALGIHLSGSGFVSPKSPYETPGYATKSCRFDITLSSHVGAVNYNIDQ